MGVWKKLIPALMDDFEGFKTSMEEVAAEVRQLKMKPKDMTKLLQSHGKTLNRQRISSYA